MSKRNEMINQNGEIVSRNYCSVQNKLTAAKQRRRADEYVVPAMSAALSVRVEQPAIERIAIHFANQFTIPFVPLLLLIGDSHSTSILSRFRYVKHQRSE